MKVLHHFVDGLEGIVLSVEDLGIDQGYGPMCSAFQVRGAAPLPDDYVDMTEGTLLSLHIGDMQSVYGAIIPASTANKTLYNDL